ncbi:MAG: flagellar filament capping protein FliD [Epsilonproteobacteria bacterium]|nr:hypothetical protein [Campylobacterota bacterium]NPA56279.1 flagellar filament capping protein FliD [Campylobacterota bacterium]
MAGEIYLSNLSGQFDYQSILDKYEQLKYQQVSIIQEKEYKVEMEKAAFESYVSMLEDFKGSFENLIDEELFDQKVVTVSDESIASVSVTDPEKVNPTKLDFTVKQLAKNDVWLSQSGVENRDDSVASGDGTLTIAIDGEEIDIEYTADDTIDDIAQKINSATDKVNASIFFDGDNYRLILSSRETGTDNAITLKDDGDLLDNLELGRDYSDSHVQEAQNAQIDIYGESVESQTNTFSNLIEGIEIEVKESSDTPVSVEIANDDEAIKSSLEDLFGKYNSLVDYIKSQSEEGAPLAGDFTLQSIRSQIFQRLTPLMERNLMEVDHTTGHISLKTTELEEQLSQDREGIQSALSDLQNSLQPYLEALFDTDGVVNQKELSYDKKIDRYEDDIAAVVERITKESEILKAQFIHLDSILAQLNDMKTQIAALLPSDETT